METLRLEGRSASAAPKLLFVVVLLVAIGLIVTNKAAIFETIHALTAPPAESSPKIADESSPYLPEIVQESEQIVAIEEAAPEPPAMTPAVAPSQQPAVASEPEPSTAAAPAPASPGGAESPAAAVEPETVESGTVAAATPEPSAEAPPVEEEEKPLDLETLAKNPAWWPKQVALVTATNFPVIFNGKVAGQALAPVGTGLRLIRVLENGQVEIDYHNQKTAIASDSTDLLERAEAVRKAAASDENAEPSFSALQAAARPASKAKAPKAGSEPRNYDRVVLEVICKKTTHVLNSYSYEKKDRINVKVKIVNQETMASFKKLRCEVYVLAQSASDSKVTRMLGSKKVTFSLEPRESEEISTEEFSTLYTDAYYRWGYQYKGWIVRVRDASGKLVLEKTTTPTIAKHADKLVKLKKEQELSY